MTAARLDGRLLGSTCRRGEAADRRWLRRLAHVRDRSKFFRGGHEARWR